MCKKRWKRIKYSKEHFINDEKQSTYYKKDRKSTGMANVLPSSKLGRHGLTLKVGS
jgi:hypothetical protein